MLEPANVAHDEYDDHLVILMMMMTMMMTLMMLLMMMTLMMLMMAFCLRNYPSHQEERHDTPSSFHLDVSPMTPYTLLPRGCKTP